jgi:3-methyladenine DNA glycosylase AlkC
MAEAPALKEIFDAQRFRTFAREIAAIHPRFDSKRFLALALRDLAALSLTQRMRRMMESLHATLPADYLKALAVLRRLAPRIERGFSTLVLPDFLGLYGVDQFDASLDALKFFTTFGSSEFGVRPFLRSDLARTLAFMETWSRDPDEQVRRLASEGCRPRLPWSFRIDALVADPTPVVPILENLRADPSLYVRKSVANHLNDITKDHPDWVLDRLESWPLKDPHTRWIAKRALRTLIKKGDRRALAVIGAGAKPLVNVRDLELKPRVLSLGERLTVSLQVESNSTKAQRLVVDYVIHYVKKSGGTSGKVFKLKELTLPARTSVTLSRAQIVRDFTTRVHHAGRHEVEIIVNGERLARGCFELRR